MIIQNDERSIYITATNQNHGTIHFQSKENIFLIDDAYESFSNLLNYFSGKVISCEPFKKNKEETKEIVSIISRNI